MLDVVLRRGSIAQAALPALLDLSQPSVARLAGSFVSDGLLRTSSRAASGRGNPSVSLSLVPEHAYGLGVGITGDALTMALVDFSGAVRETRREALVDRTRAAVAARLAAMRTDVIAASGIDEERLIGTGIALSGFFVGSPPRFNPPAVLVDWVDVDLIETLSPVLGHNLLCDNDATCAAIAEALLGVGRATPTFAYCHLTNGFGGGIIVDGRPMRGALGNAGDFGAVWWMLGGGRPDGYPALNRLHALVAEHGTLFPTVEDLLIAITPETPGLDVWLAEARNAFAPLAFLLGHIVAPEAVVIGGRLPTWLAQTLANSIELPSSPIRHDRPFPLPAVVAAEVSGEGAAIGAALMPLREVFFRCS